MMDCVITRATAEDMPALLPLMQEFYAEEHLAFSDANVAAVQELVASPALGGVYLVRNGGGVLGEVLGYFTLVFGFSVERGGRTALLDELFVVPAARGKGLGQRALASVIASAKAGGCRAVHLEVDRANKKARALYERAGFIELPRGYLTLML
jgi:GNAT superfamily N-acetyltransferase